MRDEITSQADFNRPQWPS